MSKPRFAPSDPTIQRCLADFRKDSALDLSAKTIATYSEAATSYATWAATQGITTMGAITTDSLRDWLLSLREAGRSPATIHNRQAGMKAFLAWAVDEKLYTASPMAGIKTPRIPERPIPMLSRDQLKAILATCDGTSFDDVRDNAMLRLLIDTGIRRAECAGLRTADIDEAEDVVTVRGKGDRIRACPYGPRTARALRRYMRLREAHPDQALPNLWLGKRGPLHPVEAPRHVLRRRARQAGITERVHVHQLRHTWADMMLKQLNEGDVQRLGGWRDRAMLSRYGAAGADERARLAYRGKAPGDDL